MAALAALAGYGHIGTFQAPKPTRQAPPGEGRFAGTVAG